MEKPKWIVRESKPPKRFYNYVALMSNIHEDYEKTFAPGVRYTLIRDIVSMHHIWVGFFIRCM